MTPRAALTCAALTCALLTACTDPVQDARRDGASAPHTADLHSGVPRLPPDLDLRPERQICTGPQTCTLIRGLPGQPLPTMCCATCRTRAAALNLDNARRLLEWKKRVDCAHVACAPLGDCLDARTPIGATCNAGVCALVY